MREISALIPLIRTAFPNVSEDVIQSERIGFLQTDRMGCALRIFRIPGEISKCGNIGAEKPGGFGAAATGVFPLCLGGQPISNIILF